MMGDMRPSARRRARITLEASLFCLIAGLSCVPAIAQVNYSVHFEMEKPTYLMGEPIFCRFVIRNTGSKVFAFRYRTPTRGLAPDHDQEPRFRVTDSRGQRLSDPGPRPCGSPQGTVVYGYVTLPPGQVHAERWLLNQWAQFAIAGPLSRSRRAPLGASRAWPARWENSGEKPVAFALAIDELTVLIVRSTPAQVEAAYQPYPCRRQKPQGPQPCRGGGGAHVLAPTFFPRSVGRDGERRQAGPLGPSRCSWTAWRA